MGNCASVGSYSTHSGGDGMSRPRIKVKHGEESLVSHSGLILIGDLLEATNLKDRLSRIGLHVVAFYFS